MASASPKSSSEPIELPLPPVKIDPLAAFLSYLIPGLGQIYQGRIGKGLLFFVGLYTLFFYGMWMGQWRNVWLPDTFDLPDVVIAGQRLEGVPKAISYRPQFLAQFWIGTASWPAIYQYVKFDRTKDEGPPPFKKFQRAPNEEQLNDLQRNSSKRWDLGWVYTVIAGVLNLLVIYDALAGPMFRDPPKWIEEQASETASKAATEKVAAVAAPPPPSEVPAPPVPVAHTPDNPQGGVT
ncbi:MAG: hypothetical protein K8U57_20730 [Planctomycetes bacterium]|nr:hypothetical protein [Planctomycetota bacterium]